MQPKSEAIASKQRAVAKRTRPTARGDDTTRAPATLDNSLDFRAAIDSLPDPILIVDPETMRFLYANDIACRLRGISREEYLKLKVTDVTRIEPDELKRVYAAAAANPGAGIAREFIVIREGGRQAYVEGHTRAVQLADHWGMVTVSRDITERKLAEKAAVRRSRIYELLGAANEAMLRGRTPETLYQRLCDAAVLNGKFLAAAALLSDANEHRLKVVAASGALQDGWRDMKLPLAPVANGRECLISAAYHTGQTRLSNSENEQTRNLAWHRLALPVGVKSTAAFPLIRESRAIGALFLAAGDRSAFDEESVTLLRGMTENLPYALENLERDAERRQTQEELLRFRHIMDASPDLVAIIDPETLRFIYVNETHWHLSGYQPEDYYRIPAPEIIGVAPEELRRIYGEVIAKAGEPITTEIRYRARDGRPGWFESTRRAIRMGDKWIIVTISREISTRVVAERAAARQSRMYAVLGATNEAILHAQSPNEIYQRVCDAAVNGGRFVTAAILLPDRDTATHMVAIAGQSQAVFRGIRISIDASTPEGRGLTGTAFRTLAPCISNDFLKDERTKTWHNGAAQLGIKAGAAVPLRKDGRAIGVLLLYSDEKRAFDDDIVKLIERMAENIVFALDNFARESERRAAEQAVRDSDERFRALTVLTSDWYWEQDRELRFTRFGRHEAGASNALEQRMFGKHPWEIGIAENGWEAHRADLEARRPFRDLIMYEPRPDGTRHYFSASGEPVFDHAGEFAGYRGVARDITEKKRAEERIQYLATHDGLTDLPNRDMFSELLRLAIESAKRYERRFALLFLDLDRFKVINDTLGHETGDMLLQEIAARLKHILRASDVVARLGGDEFVLLVQEAGEPGEVADVARRILATVAEPVVLAGQECRVTASIGICQYPQDADNEESLMKNADMAMYLAKEEGKNNFQFYSMEIRSQSLERLMLETKLRSALERNELSLHYQAKLDLKTNAITGVEALLRWHNPELGPVPPVQFIPVAEEIGLIVPIGKWVLKTACAQSVAWRRAGLPPLSMAVNLSARQFADENLLHDIAATLAETGMDPRQLEFEITEGMVIHNPARALKLLNAMKAMGVRLAIDDFGTGYSSLGQLKNFPIDTLKVDRSFIRDIPDDANDTAIAEAIIAMGKTLSLTVVAEGVETAEQAEFLRDHACDEMQGYYFSKPIEPEKFVELLQKSAAASRQ